MPRTRRVLAPAVATVTGIALTGALTGLAGPAVASGGPTGKTFTIKSGVTLSGYDAATTKGGTTYVGWIGDDANNPSLRQLHLCVLKLSSKSCVGGVQTANALGDSSAQNLKVVVTGGQVELVWIAQVAPDSGEFSGVFGMNTVSGGKLGTSVSVPGAPTLGSLTSAIAHKGGGVSLAAVGEVGTLDKRAYYYPTVSATPTTFTRPYFVGNAQVADNGTRTVFTTSQYGSLSGKVSVASKPSKGSTWTGFKNVPNSYTAGGIERMVTAGKHIRLVGVSAKAIYTPCSWTWKKKSFGKPKPTGDHNDIFGLDLNTDGSGRLVSVGVEGDGLGVSNFGKGSKTVRFQLKVKHTLAGGLAQISTTAKGRGFVVYGIQKTGVTGQVLVAQPIKLPMPRHHHRHHHQRGGGRAAARVRFTTPGRL